MKTVATAEEAIRDVFDGAVIMFGGFGPCGMAEDLIRALAAKGTKNLTTISNDAGTEKYGLSFLMSNGQLKKMILSYSGGNEIFRQLVLGGKLEAEWIPQGTLAERIRAAGAGIGGFYTPTGYGTLAAESKEIKEIDGRCYVLEKPLHADFAFVKAWRADKMGNLVYRKTARNFNPLMAAAARITIAEVEELFEVGEIAPDHIHTPGVYIKRIFHAAPYKKTIERRMVRPKCNSLAS